MHAGHLRTLLPALLCRSIAETFCPADFVEMIRNKKGEREGWTVYGFTKMANIWMAKVGGCLLKHSARCCTLCVRDECHAPGLMCIKQAAWAWHSGRCSCTQPQSSRVSHLQSFAAA